MNTLLRPSLTKTRRVHVRPWRRIAYHSCKPQTVGWGRKTLEVWFAKPAQVEYRTVNSAFAWSL